MDEVATSMRPEEERVDVVDRLRTYVQSLGLDAYDLCEAIFDSCEAEAERTVAVLDAELTSGDGARRFAAVLDVYRQMLDVVRELVNSGIDAQLSFLAARHGGEENLRCLLLDISAVGDAGIQPRRSNLAEPTTPSSWSLLLRSSR